ncbi:hypothetical protein CYMTET_8198 [Cymbomonas tetramitiformis]|uniref:Nab N-terminal domain-containing protein n=1 Tax=Cymbomonas tetramitiformis TaxID=36881 RepID=A0AAE0GU35_9CHLO|nr:hypothetical protein CYMTET_8198 [Cymbomonas tetramitiformis]
MMRVSSSVSNRDRQRPSRASEQREVFSPLEGVTAPSPLDIEAWLYEASHLILELCRTFQTTCPIAHLDVLVGMLNQRSIQLVRDELLALGKPQQRMPTDETFICPEELQPIRTSIKELLTQARLGEYEEELVKLGGTDVLQLAQMSEERLLEIAHKAGMKRKWMIRRFASALSELRESHSKPIAVWEEAVTKGSCITTLNDFIAAWGLLPYQSAFLVTGIDLTQLQRLPQNQLQELVQDLGLAHIELATERLEVGIQKLQAAFHVPSPPGSEAEEDYDTFDVDPESDLASLDNFTFQPPQVVVPHEHTSPSGLGAMRPMRAGALNRPQSAGVRRSPEQMLKPTGRKAQTRPQSASMLRGQQNSIPSANAGGRRSPLPAPHSTAAPTLHGSQVQDAGGDSWSPRRDTNRSLNDAPLTERQGFGRKGNVPTTLGVLEMRVKQLEQAAVKADLRRKKETKRRQEVENRLVELGDHLVEVHGCHPMCMQTAGQETEAGLRFASNDSNVQRGPTSSIQNDVQHHKVPTQTPWRSLATPSSSMPTPKAPSAPHPSRAKSTRSEAVGGWVQPEPEWTFTEFASVGASSPSYSRSDQVMYEEDADFE